MEGRGKESPKAPDEVYTDIAARYEGRQMVLKALLATPGHTATIQNLMEWLGGTKTPITRSVFRLVAEGLVRSVHGDSDEWLKSGQPSRYTITEKGLTVGHTYQPSKGGSPSEGWGRPGRTRAAVLAVLVQAKGWSTVQSIAEQSGLAATSNPLRQALSVGHTSGYLLRATLSETPTTYGYLLTELGEAEAEQYLADCAQLLATESYAVTLAGSDEQKAAARAALDALRAMPGVTIKP